MLNNLDIQWFKKLSEVNCYDFQTDNAEKKEIKDVDTFIKTKYSLNGYILVLAQLKIVSIAKNYYRFLYSND